MKRGRLFEFWGTGGLSTLAALSQEHTVGYFRPIPLGYNSITLPPSEAYVDYNGHDLIIRESTVTTSLKSLLCLTTEALLKRGRLFEFWGAGLTMLSHEHATLGLPVPLATTDIL